jgi:ATP-dependent Lon protease
LKDYLGLPKFFDSRLFPGIPPCGVMIGLAYNAYGGSIMYIETAVTNLVKNKTVEESKDKEK